MEGKEYEEIIGGVTQRKTYWLYMHVVERWLYICQNMRDLENELRMNGRFVSVDALKRDWNVIGKINPSDLRVTFYKDCG